MTKEGRWIKERKKIAKYPKTEQQIKIAEAGKEIGEKCVGREGDIKGLESVQEIMSRKA